MSGNAGPAAGNAANQLNGAFDGRVEALATTGPLQLVPVCGGVELGACSRWELDAFHERF